MNPNDSDPFERLIAVLKRHKIIKTLRTFVDPDAPHPPRPVRYQPRTPHLRSVHDRPRTRLPNLTHALRRRADHWRTHCDRCGVYWVGTLRSTTLPTHTLTTLAVLRVPCPICWADTWSSLDQATRDATPVRGWLTPRCR